ncbi:glycosyltransferase family 2 protein [Escherichia albertii]|uniref:Predicted glycosyltransferase family 2 n=1 Tax=Escherichia albertii TaxID=208962 RepID=A0A5A4U4A7_ESCAL|nr:glycosyltransferase family 2 protein [Escherichia albertii]EFF0784675.1 glycosyltransferase family 2 protein [Escherichia albertii]MCZ8652362.1 glycosyltransferase family 2 protein [Escherichia albertii]WDB32647.1 glycosyltransferase family 2 protein [Escherichia albertii]WDB77281.1 glycosyltransferase family 2 protein [Escherichia albertii]BBM62807.1 predicted glycosyltransferase family 2 [Escherichia albertii]
MSSKASSITAIIVTFNPEPNIFHKVIESISSQIQHIIVVDNSSQNRQEFEIYLNQQNDIILLPQDNNIGLAAAQNIGIQYAKDKLNSTHIILFDQDSIIEPNFVVNLIDEELKLKNEGHKIAAIGPSFYDPENNKIYPATLYCGPFIRKVMLGEQPVEATFLIASGCLINMDVIKHIGYMLEDLFIDYIDVEWSLRAKKFGYKLFITSKSSMAHSIGDKRISLFGRTISCHSSLRRYYLVRNSFKMLRLPYVPIGYKFRETIFNILRVLIGFAMSTDKKKFTQYTIVAFKDGVSGKFGPCKYKF